MSKLLSIVLGIIFLALLVVLVYVIARKERFDGSFLAYDKGNLGLRTFPKGSAMVYVSERMDSGMGLSQLYDLEEVPPLPIGNNAGTDQDCEAKQKVKCVDKYDVYLNYPPCAACQFPTAWGSMVSPGSGFTVTKNSTDPGYYWVNTYDLKSRTLYTIPALTVHEAVPGHHLQSALNNELGDSIPRFRRNLYLSAYGEGWGLYTEFLADEMGIYTTPYEKFGKFTYEMWRACRLVVDTGLHAKGWSKEKAIDYMSKNTALSLHEVNTEIDRYISWPGQALSYKIGELKIRELRNKAKDKLNDKFDIREFHEKILEIGRAHV